MHRRSTRSACTACTPPGLSTVHLLDPSPRPPSLSCMRNASWLIYLLLFAGRTDGFTPCVDASFLHHVSPIRIAQDTSLPNKLGLYMYRSPEDNDVGRGNLSNESTGYTNKNSPRKRSNKLERIKRSRSVREVHRTLVRSKGPSSDLRNNLQPKLAAAALRKISDLRSIFMATKKYRRHLAPEVEDALNKKESNAAQILLPDLLHIVGTAIMSDLKDLPSSRSKKQMSPFSLLDTLYSLAKLSDTKQRMDRKRGRPSSDDKGGGGGGGGGSFRPLAEATCKAIVSDDGGKSYIKQLWHTSLVETVWSLAKLDIREHPVLLDAVGNRLEKSDACGKLSGRQLVTALWSYAALERPHTGLMRSVMRRLRKVRSQLTVWDITQALWASTRLIDRLDVAIAVGEDATEHDFVVAAEMREEVEKLCFTLSEELIRPVGSDEAKPKLLDLAPGHVADVLSACATLELDDSAPILTALSCHLRLKNVLKRCSIQDIARIFLSFQRLGLRSETDTARLLGNRFAELVKSDAHCDGKTLTMILRAIAMLFPPADKSTNAAFDAASRIILDAKSGASFRSSCNEFEVCNIIWSFARAYRVDTAVMLKLADRMMEESIVGQCSPSSASRMLWSYTVLLSIFDECREDTCKLQFDGNEDVAALRDKLFQLFQSLGGIMLSSQLTPKDCSSAMWAMAKASYPLDMAIFDHLSEVLTSDSMLKRMTVRQASEALWACGLMTKWEGMQEDEMSTVLEPPYLESAKKLATFLFARKHEMSPRDVAQSIWAVGRLQGLTEKGVLAEKVEDLSTLAANVAPKSNGIEVASILYGLTRLGYIKGEVINIFTERFTEPSVLQECSAREISAVMYALGTIQHRDPDLFALLSAAIMKNIDTASSESIANALAAYEAVNLIPPRLLFDHWANQKLGIMARHSYISQVVGDAVASPAIDLQGYMFDFEDSE